MYLWVVYLICGGSSDSEKSLKTLTSDVLPMIYRALESETTQIQELCLSIIPGFAGNQN
jgi:hypothetical protein